MGLGREVFGEAARGKKMSGKAEKRTEEEFFRPDQAFLLCRKVFRLSACGLEARSLQRQRRPEKKELCPSSKEGDGAWKVCTTPRGLPLFKGSSRLKKGKSLSRAAVRGMASPPAAGGETLSELPSSSRGRKRHGVQKESPSRERENDTELRISGVKLQSFPL